MKFWSGIANRYGGIARVPLMKGQVAYLVSDPELLYELLITNRHKYRKNIRYRAAVELFGHGLLLNEGEAWKRQRLLSQPAFKADYIAAQVPWMARAHGARFLDALARARGRAARLRRRRRVLEPVADACGLLLDGPGLRAHRRTVLPRGRRRQGRVAAATAQHRAAPAPPRRRLDRGPRRGRARHRRLHREYLTAERRRDFAGAGLVKMLVDGSRAQGDEFDDRSLRDQILTVFFAGHETTAKSLSWIHYLLDEHPEARAKLRAEVDRVLGGARRRAPISTARVHGAGHQRSAAAVLADSLDLARGARGRHARRLSHSGRRHDLRVAVCDAPLAVAMAGAGPIRSRALHQGLGRAPAALRLHPVRCRPPQLRRRAARPSSSSS